jgi:hypothetical protein
MSNSNNRVSLRDSIFKKIAVYSQKAGRLGRRARELVFGFRLRSTAHTDRWALPVKLLHDHRILQRWRTHRQSGGHRSSIAKHALKKARHGRQQP